MHEKTIDGRKLLPFDRIVRECYLRESGVKIGLLPAYSLHILRLRALLCLSQTHFASLLPVRPETLSRWECGRKRPSRRFAAIMGFQSGTASACFRDTRTLTAEEVQHIVEWKAGDS
jgi:hypothetical protein